MKIIRFGIALSGREIPYQIASAFALLVSRDWGGGATRKNVARSCVAIHYVGRLCVRVVLYKLNAIQSPPTRECGCKLHHKYSVKVELVHTVQTVPKGN